MKITPLLPERISKQGYVLGSWINSASPIIAEVMAYSGFDFLAIDVEHSAVDLFQTQVLIQAIQAGNKHCHPLVRLPSTEKSLIKRYLDAGASGVIAPMVNNAEIVQEVVSSAKYPPVGTRGVGYSRSNKYGMDFDRSIPNDNERIFICMQIEHIDGVKNLEKILVVPGIDAVLIGPYDLSASMGVTGKLNHPDMINAKKMILDGCKRHNIIPGIHIVKPDFTEAISYLEEGFQFIAFSLDITIISEKSREFMDYVRRSTK